jgi:formylglycine-generating enzyme required for sulfatase activity
MPPYADHYTGSHALVIGISAYRDSAISNLYEAENDARRVAKVFESAPYHFSVTTLLGAEATVEAVRGALKAYRKTGPDDCLLIYFSGHGITQLDLTDKESGYLVCYDTEVIHRVPFEIDPDSALEMDSLKDLRRYVRAKHIGFILDCCFSGKALGLGKGAAVAAEKWKTQQAWQVISAGTAHQTVPDYPSMTHYMLPMLENPREPVTLEALGMNLKELISGQAGKLQIPQFGHIPGDGGGNMVLYTPPETRLIDLLPDDLRADLTDENPRVRRLAVQAARDRLNDPQIGGALQAVLDEMQTDDPDAEVRRAAKEVLHAAPVIQTAPPPPRVEVIAPPPAQPALVEPARLDFEPEMLLIPAGPFLMGSPKSDQLRYADEPEQFELNLDYDYAIGKVPVTVGQYRAFMEAGGYSEQRWWTAAGWQARAEGWDYVNSEWKTTGKTWVKPRLWDDKKWAGDDKLPVVGVSWYEGVAYTRWLAEATGRDYRLLTETEWEKAARGGLTIPDGRGGMKKNPYPARIWPWGDEEPDKKRLNFNGEVGRTTPVGDYPTGASPYGVQDMAGNVWEWCLSKWADPFVHPEDNDLEGDSLRLLRGGSWYYDHQDCRVSVRNWYVPFIRSFSLGFRVGGVVPVLK